MSHKILLISEETLLERIKELGELHPLNQEHRNNIYARIEIFNEILSSIAKPLVMPSENEIKVAAGYHSKPFSIDQISSDWACDNSFVDGCKFVIDKINSQLGKIK